MNQAFEESRTKLLPHSNCFIPFWTLLPVAGLRRLFAFGDRAGGRYAKSKVWCARVRKTQRRFTPVLTFGEQGVKRLLALCATAPAAGPCSCSPSLPERTAPVARLWRARQTEGLAQAGSAARQSRARPQKGLEHFWCLWHPRCCKATFLGCFTTPWVPKAPKMFPKGTPWYFNPVVFRILLENTGVKWNHEVSKSLAIDRRASGWCSPSASKALPAYSRFALTGALRLFAQNANPCVLTPPTGSCSPSASKAGTARARRRRARHKAPIRAKRESVRAHSPAGLTGASHPIARRAHSPVGLTRPTGECVRACSLARRASARVRTTSHGQSNQLISSLGLNSNSTASAVKFSFVRESRLRRGRDLNQPLLQMLLRKSKSALFRPLQARARQSRAAEPACAKPSVWRARQRRATGAVCSGGFGYPLDKAIIVGRDDAVRFIQGVYAEPMTVTKAITDSYCGAVNTLQWYVQVPIEDQTAARLLQARQGLSFKGKLLQNKSGLCRLTHELALCTSKRKAQLGPMDQCVPNLRFGAPAVFVLDIAACKRDRPDVRTTIGTVHPNPKESLLLRCGPWNMVTSSRYKTIRPLLNLSRESLTTLCKHLQLPVYPDKSNKAVQYSRNRLREQIIPAVKLFVNPKVEEALFKLAELLTQDFSAVSHLIKSKRRIKV